ncbi:MAG: PEP-CTERM sorting domain-containing protein [Pseudomonadota bacterium]
MYDKLKCFGIGAALMLAPVAAQATPVTLEFDDVDEAAIPVGGSVIEDGFALTVESGLTFGTTTVGNPAGALAIGLSFPVGIGDTLSLSALDGSRFSLDALEFGAFAGAVFPDGTFSDGVDIFAVDGGVSTLIFGDLATSSIAFQPLDLSSGLVDEIQFVGSSVGESSLLLDNIALTLEDDDDPVEVPAPGALGLLGLGLMGVGVLRRKRS